MSSKIFLVLFFLISYSIDLSSQCNCNCDVQRDSLVLVAFKSSIFGSILGSWTPINDIEDWTGVYLNDEGCVQSLKLNSANLQGEIPPEIGNLECLEKLELPVNDLTGEIPSEIGNLECLTELSLGINELTGPLPPEIGNLINLERLVLNINNLSGTIPPEIGNLINLNSLALHDNNLVGCIPEELLIFCDINLFNLSGNYGLAFLGDEEDFCNGMNQIGSECYIDGQFGTIDENCNCAILSNTGSIKNEINFKVFPNPFCQELRIESDQYSIQEIRIYDIHGAIKFNQNQNQNVCTIIPENLTPGIYFIEVFIDNESKVLKIFKE